MHPDNKRPNFNNLVFWDAVRHHPTANLDFLLADKMGLDTGQMLETHVAHLAWSIN